MNSLSLFSGYSGLDMAISDWAKPILYCEKDLYAKGMLLSRMDDGSIPFAPIWNDVTTLDGNKLRGLVDLIVGGFPCQDLSVAGRGAGLAGKRSGLFYEVVRLVKEIQPSFVFLENVPAIRTRGLEQVIKEFAEMGYDCRWTMLSASSVGANHKRERWFFLAHTNGAKLREQSRRSSGQNGEGSHELGHNGSQEYLAHSLHNGLSATEIGRSPCESYENAQARKNGRPKPEGRQEAVGTRVADSEIPHPLRQRLQRQWQQPSGAPEKQRYACDDSWWAAEPYVGRVANGVMCRVDRTKALGNGVVPLQAKEAFIKLMGLK